MADRTDILAIGENLRDARVENTEFRSARTLLEHEIVLWNPRNVLASYSTGNRFEGSICLSLAGSAAYQRDAERRWLEFHDYLGLGRLLVVLLPAPMRFYTDTGREENEGTAGKPRMSKILDTRSVEDLIPVEFESVLANGERFRVLEGEPFATFWRSVGEQFLYEAYLKDPVGTPLLSIYGADRVVGALVHAHGGVVLLLPQRYEYKADDQREPGESLDAFEYRQSLAQEALEKRVSGQFVDALLDLARELRGAPEEELPDWTTRYLLPGEPEASAAVQKAEDGVARALRRAEKASSKLKHIQREKILLAGTGLQLEIAVERALTMLGCQVEPGDPGRADRIIRWKGNVGVVEVKGLTKTAREKDAAQLEKWVSTYAIEHGCVPKGILLLNAWRSKPPHERTVAFPPQMCPYAESRQQCLVTTSQLLTALTTASTAYEKASFLDALFNTVGVLEGWDLPEPDLVTA